MMSCTSASFDSALYSTLGGDPDLAELVELFVAEMPERISHLWQQYKGSNWEQLGRTAHQLKGAAGSYGFHPLTPLAGELEAAVRSRAAPQQILARLEALTALCKRVRAGAAP